MLSFPNFDNKNKHARYTWYDEPYRNFIMDFLMYLETRCEEPNTILFAENDEFSEVLLFQKGTYAVGFELNQVKKMAIALHNN